jgi:hypothetical protein
MLGSSSRRATAVGAAAVAVVTAAACSSPGPAPFQAEVPGAVSATDWVPERPMQLGAPGDVLTPELILDELVEIELGVLPNADVTRSLEARDGDTIGYLRAVVPMTEHPFRARDTRVHLEETDTGWRIVAIEQRYHCATEEPNTDFCQ